MTERISAHRTISATPEQIFAVVTDPDGHVAMDSSGMLQGATGHVVAQVGDSFVVHMDREALGDLPMGKYDVRVLVTNYRQPTAVEWTIEGTVRPPIGHVYGLELEQVSEQDTTVTSYCDWSRAAPEWKPIFPVIDKKALRASLGLLDRAVRRGYPQPNAPTKHLPS